MWNVLSPGTAVLLDATGLHDKLGTIRWPDVSDAWLSVVRGGARLSFFVSRAKSPERGHPHDVERDDTWSWDLDLD